MENLNDNEVSELLNYLMYDVLIKIRLEADKINNDEIFYLADLIHSVPNSFRLSSDSNPRNELNWLYENIATAQD